MKYLLILSLLMSMVACSSSTDDRAAYHRGPNAVMMKVYAWGIPTEWRALDSVVVIHEVNDLIEVGDIIQDSSGTSYRIIRLKPSIGTHDSIVVPHERIGKP